MHEVFIDLEKAKATEAVFCKGTNATNLVSIEKGKNASLMVILKIHEKCMEHY